MPGAGDREEESRAFAAPRLAVLSGWRGVAIAWGAAIWMLFALWLISTGAPSAAGEPFRFTPPPETPPAATLAPAELTPSQAEG